MNMMAKDYLGNGMSIIYDAPLNKRAQRRLLREQTKRPGLEHVHIWVQTDINTAFDRATDRDRRQQDDKYSVSISDDIFNQKVDEFKKPLHETYVVISGKHVYRNQSHAVKQKLNDLGIIGRAKKKTPTGTPIPVALSTTHKRRVKLGGPVDMARRNLKRKRT